MRMDVIVTGAKPSTIHLTAMTLSPHTIMTLVSSPYSQARDTIRILSLSVHFRQLSVIIIPPPFLCNGGRLQCGGPFFSG